MHNKDTFGENDKYIYQFTTNILYSVIDKSHVYSFLYRSRIYIKQNIPILNIQFKPWVFITYLNKGSFFMEQPERNDNMKHKNCHPGQSTVSIVQNTSGRSPKECFVEACSIKPPKFQFISIKYLGVHSVPKHSARHDHMLFHSFGKLKIGKDINFS